MSLTYRLINEFNDEIYREHQYTNIKITPITYHYSYWHWDRDTKKKVWGSVNKVKKYVNDKRGIKTKWTESPC